MLHWPDNRGRHHLYSDTSKFATGSALYQIQNGKPKLIAYASKGRDMILSDFISTQKHDDSNQHEIILISFNMQGILKLDIIIYRKEI